MTRPTSLTAILLIVAACSNAPDEPAVTEPDLVVLCGDVIDGLADEPIGARYIVVREQRIAEILPADDPSMMTADTFDLSDKTCLPGLIDTHVHLDGLPEDADDYNIYLQRSPEDTHELAEQLAKTVLEQGFTTVRNTGTYLAWADRVLRDKIETGTVVGPRVQIAGPYLTIPHGGGDMYIPGVDDSEIPQHYRLGVARGADEFRERTAYAIAGGAEFIKIIASGAVFGHGSNPGAPEMTREEIAAVVEVAHAAGVKVTAHAHSAESIKDAILAGVDSIEHASLGDDESVALAAEHDVVFSMDVYNGTYTEEYGRENGYAEEFMVKNEQTTEAQRVVFEKALAAGVKIVFGTDLGVLPHDMGAHQFEVMVERGMTPMQAIKSATSLAAKHMSWESDVGAIEPGRFADLVAVSVDPLADISSLQNIDVVIKGGKLVRKSGKPKLPVADAVYHTGKVYTLDDEQPWAQAVAIRNGKIVFVGSDDRVRAYIGPDTESYDLRGRMMLPAFQDVHIHAISSALDIVSCDLHDDNTVAEYLRTLKDCAAARPDAEWIRGAGWSMSAFGPGAVANKELLDEVVPDRPVYLESSEGHSGWVNSRALEIAAVDENTPDPKDGIIDRDPETGEPTGSLQEDAVNLIYNVLPDWTVEQRIDALVYSRDMLHRLGITSVQTGYSYADDLEAYLALDEKDELNLRVLASLMWDSASDLAQLPGLLELREKYSRNNLRPNAIKIFQDGVLENFTAGVLEPYLTEEGGIGMTVIDPEQLKTIVTALDNEAFQVHFHAIGDAAVRQCLDAVEAAVAANGESDGRHHIAHVQLIHSEDYPRFAALNVTANFQPYWASLSEYITELNVPFLGEGRSNRMYPIKSIVDAGGRVAFGSDWAVSSADPLLGIETAVTRLDPDDNDFPPLNSDEAISLEQAIRGYTIGAAYVNHHDNVTGTIEIGKLADLIVLDKNLFAIEPGEISESNVILTLFGGNPVFGDPTQL